MPVDHFDAGSFCESSIREQILYESPYDDDEVRPQITNPRLVPDLSFLSANFSNESLPHGIERDQVSMAGTSNMGSDGSAGSAGSLEPLMAPYNPNRRSFNGSASARKQLFSFHKRSGSTSSGSRGIPRSFIAPESTGIPIWEFGGGLPVVELHNGNIEYDKKITVDPARRSTTPPNSSFISQNEILPSLSGSGSANSSRNGSPRRERNTFPFKQRVSSPGKSQGFDFKPQDLSISGKNGTLVTKAAHRKGHRYKHSSVSMNLFQEPLPIADANLQPNLIPDSYPIPNLKECCGSASRKQKLKIGMSLAHFLTSVAVFLVGVRTQQSAFSTLSHLIFYDSLGSLMASCVDVMSSFEVWAKSSIAYPFGLGRLEVLASFALSTSSVMVGCDLISHFVEELVVGFVGSSTEATTDHGSHHIHSSADSGAAGWFLYELALVWVIAVTWITSTYIFDNTSLLKLISTDLNKETISDINVLSRKNALVQRVKAISKVLVTHPIRLLTLVYSTFLSLVPLIPDDLKDEFGFDLNETSTLVVALLLCFAGWNLVKTLGGILLISFPYSEYDFDVTKATLYDRITGLACFKAAYSLEKLNFSKANSTLYLVSVHVVMKGGSSDDESRLVFEINRIIMDTMEKFEAGCSVETTISAERM